MNEKMVALLVLLLFGAESLVQAQFTWVTNSDGVSVTITGYTGPGGSVIIPNNINNLLITIIGESAFDQNDSLISVTIPDSVTNIGQDAFFGCESLVNVFFNGNGPTMGDDAFGSCKSLSGAYFYGNGSDGGSLVHAFWSFPFGDDTKLYYLPGTLGWDHGGDLTRSGYDPTALWTLPYPLILNNSFGFGTNGLGFTVSWATNAAVVVEACTNLANPVWQPLQTNTLTATTNGGFFNFSDPQWTNYPNRFYRLHAQ